VIFFEGLEFILLSFFDGAISSEISFDFCSFVYWLYKLVKEKKSGPPVSARNRAITFRGQKTRKFQIDFKDAKLLCTVPQSTSNGVFYHFKLVFVKKMGPVHRPKPIFFTNTNLK
jgi:hypothetical protein